MMRLLEAKANGQQIIVTHGLHEVSPSEAAMMLGMSRPQVRKLLDEGVLLFRMVGTHHRIPVLRSRRSSRSSVSVGAAPWRNSWHCRTSLG
jgi:excisionase family DNA binding protein